MLLKQSLLVIVVFYRQKHPRGGSIHEIKESFPLKPSLVTILNALINIFLSFVAEIADNASLSCVEETGSSATESDSIGSLRNSSPENINTVASLTTLAGSCSSKDLGLSHKNKGISHGNRISSPSPRINR